MSTATVPRVTAEEYLAFERASELKHEFRDGEIVLMVGAKWPHNRVTANAVAILTLAFRGRPCEVNGSDQRVKVMATGNYYYPDVSALCGEPVFEDADDETLLNPRVIMEVESPSTQAFDRGEKFENYRQIPSLTDYLLASQRRVHVEHFHRDGDDWILREYKSLRDVIRPDSLDCSIPLAELYDKVKLG